MVSSNPCISGSELARLLARGGEKSNMRISTSLPKKVPGHDRQQGSDSEMLQRVLKRTALEMPRYRGISIRWRRCPSVPVGRPEREKRAVWARFLHCAGERWTREEAPPIGVKVGEY
jgi:hypothetical protein